MDLTLQTCLSPHRRIIDSNGGEEDEEEEFLDGANKFRLTTAGNLCASPNENLPMLNESWPESERPSSIRYGFISNSEHESKYILIVIVFFEENLIHVY